MVTGVETAGFVLGVIPLLISALEHYEDAVEPTKAFFFHWRGNLSTAIDELMVLYAAYDQSLRLLLTPLATREDLVAMMEDPKHALWSQGEVVDDLRAHLGNTYAACILTIDEIAETLMGAVKNLNIPGAQSVRLLFLLAQLTANPRQGLQ
jgi:hypothetical protein